MTFRLAWRDAILADEDLSSSAKLVGLVLEAHMNRDGGCWPSVETVMRKASLSRRTVQGGVRELEAFGYIDPGDKKGGRKRSNQYQALLPTEEERAQQVRRFQASERQRKLEKGARDVAQRAQQTTKKGAPGAPKPVKNPTTNSNVGEHSAVATSSPTRAGSRRDAPVAALGFDIEEDLRRWLVDDLGDGPFADAARRARTAARAREEAES